MTPPGGSHVRAKRWLAFGILATCVLLIAAYCCSAPGGEAAGSRPATVQAVKDPAAELPLVEIGESVAMTPPVDGVASIEDRSEQATPPIQEISVRVVDRSGGPVDGASVLVWRSEKNPIFGDESENKQSFKMSTYLLARARRADLTWSPAEDTVKTNGDGYCAFTSRAPFTIVWAEHVDVGTSGARVVPHSGTRSSQELVLYPQATVRGRVLNADGSGCMGAQILLNTLRNETSDATARKPRDLITGSDGRFEFMVDAPLRAGIIAVLGERSSANKFLRTKPGRIEEVILTLVGDQTVHGVVRDPRGWMVPGARVVAIKQENGSQYQAESGQDGRYELPLAGPGSYALVAQATGYVLEQPVTITLTDRSIECDLQLSEGASILGQVVSRHGSVEQLMVMGLETSEVAVGSDPALAVGALTDPDGRFEVRECRDGRKYSLRVTDAAGAQAELKDVVAGSSVVMELLLPTSVRGLIRDSKSGVPIADARVVAELWLADIDASSGFSLAEAQSDSEGAFELRGLASDGIYGLRIAAEGFAPVGGRRVDLSEREPIVIELCKAASLEVIASLDRRQDTRLQSVALHRGKPADLQELRDPIRHHLQDGTNRARWDELQPGAYWIEAECDAGRYLKSVDLLEGEQRTVELDCTAATGTRDVTVRLNSASGAGVEGRVVCIRAKGQKSVESSFEGEDDSPSDDIKRANTDASGVATFRLEEGVYVLGVTAECRPRLQLVVSGNVDIGIGVE